MVSSSLQIKSSGIAKLLAMISLLFCLLATNLAYSKGVAGSSHKIGRAPAQVAPGTPETSPGTPENSNAQQTPPGTESGNAGNANQQATPPPESKINKSEEEDYSSTPFTSYGEFNENEDEEADSKFFQYGRFFGVSLGLGAEMIDGNRGTLWQGGFPMVDFKVHYWFDFQVALDLGFFTAQQYYDTTVKGLGHVDINVVHVGVDVKYYFQTKNLSSALSFASPYLLAGAGSYTKTENSQAQATQDPDTSLGVSLGLGLEFVISPRKSYFEIEAKGHLVVFKDTYTTNFSASVPNLTGNFYTVSGSVLFTW
jgi:hypothetical protein